jgi:hypothetical protein
MDDLPSTVSDTRESAFIIIFKWWTKSWGWRITTLHDSIAFELKFSALCNGNSGVLVVRPFSENEVSMYVAFNIQSQPNSPSPSVFTGSG